LGGLIDINKLIQYSHQTINKMITIVFAYNIICHLACQKALKPKPFLQAWLAPKAAP